MKKITTLFVIAAMLSLAAFEAMAQRPEGGRGPGRGGPGGMAGMNPLFAALDVNADGEIDAAEINNAAVALKKLDKNKDGKIDSAEARPDVGRRGEFGGQGQGQGGNRADRIMQFDENKDGKVSKEELPERMARMMERLDADSDGFITKEELENARGARQGERPQRPQRDR